MRSVLLLTLIVPALVWAAPAKKQPPPAAAKAAAAPAAKAVELQSDDDKALYALGVMFSDQLRQFDLSASELAIVQEGLSDGVLKREKKVKVEEMRSKVQELAKARQARLAEVEKKRSAEYLAKAAAEPGVKKTESGLLYKELKTGDGPMPKASDKVKVHYTGTLTDGSVFDSSVQRGEPAEFPLNGVIKCWTEGVQMIKKGGKARLICPSDIAYGDRGAPPKIPGGATLVFEVELLDITTPAVPPASPAAPTGK